MDTYWLAFFRCVRESVDILETLEFQSGLRKNAVFMDNLLLIRAAEIRRFGSVGIRVSSVRFGRQEETLIRFGSAAVKRARWSDRFG